MNVVKFRILLFIVFTTILFLLSQKQNEILQKERNELHNNVLFEGRMLGVKKSNNHDFGIIYVRLTKSNVKVFKKLLRHSIFPYRIKDTLAEIYTTIDIEGGSKDFIQLNSNKAKIYIINKFGKVLDSSGIDLVDLSDGSNINFIEENSIIK